MITAVYLIGIPIAWYWFAQMFLTAFEASRVSLFTFRDNQKLSESERFYGAGFGLILALAWPATVPARLAWRFARAWIFITPAERADKTRAREEDNT